MCFCCIPLTVGGTLLGKAKPNIKALQTPSPPTPKQVGLGLSCEETDYLCSCALQIGPGANRFGETASRTHVVVLETKAPSPLEEVYGHTQLY